MFVTRPVMLILYEFDMVQARTGQLIRPIREEIFRPRLFGEDDETLLEEEETLPSDLIKRNDGIINLTSMG